MNASSDSAESARLRRDSSTTASTNAILCTAEAVAVDRSATKNRAVGPTFLTERRKETPNIMIDTMHRHQSGKALTHCRACRIRCEWVINDHKKATNAPQILWRSIVLFTAQLI
jgi:hypothetical protein